MAGKRSLGSTKNAQYQRVGTDSLFLTMQITPFPPKLWKISQLSEFAQLFFYTSAFLLHYFLHLLGSWIQILCIFSITHTRVRVYKDSRRQVHLVNDPPSVWNAAMNKYDVKKLDRSMNILIYKARAGPFKNKLAYFVLLALLMCCLLVRKWQEILVQIQQKGCFMYSKSGMRVCVWGGGSTYFQPIICPQQQQNMSATVCIPESIILSSEAPVVMFTLKQTPSYAALLLYEIEDIKLLKVRTHSLRVNPSTWPRHWNADVHVSTSVYEFITQNCILTTSQSLCCRQIS